MEIRRTTRIFNLALFGFIQVILSQSQTAPPFLEFKFVSEPSDVVVQSGTTVSLNCSVQTNFRPTFDWYKDGTRLPFDSRYQVTLDGTLRIQRLTQSDTGSYMCQVYDSGNTFTVNSREASVSIATLSLDPPFPVDVTDVYLEDTARFECRTEGSGPITYEWFRDRQRLDLSEEVIAARYSLLPSGTLEIVGLRSGDVGAYRCRATSAQGLQVTSRQAMLRLQRGRPPSSRVFAFTKSLEGTETEYKLGTPVILEVATTQPADFRWYKDEGEISLSGNHYSYVGQGSLYIEELTEIDTATYKVVAISQADQSEILSSTSILVLVPPTFIEPPRNMYAREGEVAILPCNVYGIFPPTVVWMRDGDPITMGRDFQFVQGKSLSIRSALQSDSGFYQCVASNQVGNVQSSMQLIVLGEDVPIPVIRTTPSSTAMPTTTTEPPPPPTQLPIIIDPPIIDPPDGLVPSQPRRAGVSRTTSRTTYLTWQPPAVTNGEIRKYRILLKAEGSDIRDRIIFVSGDTAKIIRDLLPDTLYNVQILAINDDGPGEMTDPISFRTLEAVNVPEEQEFIDATAQSSSSILVIREEPIDTIVNVPEEPEFIDATAQSSSSVLVTWEEPIDTFGDLEGYRLYYAVQDGLASREVEVPVRGTSHLVEGLDPYTAYGFRVLAINANGAGESTDVTYVQTFSAKPGSPPANLTSESTSTSAITLDWDPPGSDQNGMITEYKIRYRIIGSKESKEEIKVAGSLTSYIVSELERSTGYEFKIAAVTVNGTGPYTEIWLQEFTRERDVGESRAPDKPAALRAVGFSDHIEVEWAPPSDPYTRVGGYMLDYGKGVPGPNSVELGADTRSFTIRDVDVNTLYVICLRAYNRAGEGREQMETVFTSQEVTSLAVPFPVEALTQSDSSIRLQWNDPNPQRDGTVYTISYNLEDMSTVYKQLNTTNQYYVFNDLKPFSTYVFFVRISQGSLRSDLSMEARNTTLEAVPATAPTGLIVRGYDNSSSLLLLWNGPSRPNGVITGYVLYYTNKDQTTSIADWEKLDLAGNKTTYTLVDLDEDSVYYVRVQAVNGVGLSPISDVATGTTGAAVIPPLPNTGGEGAGGGATGAGTGALAGFPWWLWLIAAALFFLLLLLLLLLLLCALCGCFKCCASMCPCCGEICGAGGCFGQCWQGLARCFAGCCPCCCSDEEECAGFCSKLCCGACICGGVGAKSGSGMNGAATAISGGTYKSNGPDVLMSSSVEETDALMNAHGEATTEFGGSGKVEANGGMTINRHGSVYETDDGRMRVNGQYWIRDGRQHGQHYLQRADSASYDHSVASLKAASRTYSEILNGKREPIIKKSTGYFEGDRGFEREHHAGSAEGTGQNITYNTTNVHVAGEHDSGSHSELGRRGAVTPVTSVSTQMVNYPASMEGAVDPFTITFEETTTTHSVEKSVPLMDGTNYKTISNHETHSKSYSTSDASKDRNLQMMLQNGLDQGPLAIDVPSTRMEPLSAITAPVYSRSTLDRGTSSLDSYSSSSHNQVSSDTNLQAASRATTNLHTYESENQNHASDLNMQSSRATTNLDSYQGIGLPYRVELPATLPRHGSNYHTSFEEHSESRMQDYGTGTGTGRVDIASRHMAETDGQIIRQEESKESFPYTMPDMFGGDLTHHHETGLHSLPQMNYLPVDERAHQSSSGQFQSALGQSSDDHVSGRYHSSRRPETSSDRHYGTDTLQSHRSAMSDSQYGTGNSDMINSGSAYRYKSNASLDGGLGGASGGRESNFQTIDRSEGLDTMDRLENLRRLTNKVLSSSSTRLATQNGTEPMITKSSGYFEGDRGFEREQPITKSTGYFEGDRGIDRQRLHAYSTDHLDRTGGHSQGFESGFSQRQVYRSGSSGYQSMGNLASGGGGGQYSFNNNNSKSDLTDYEPTGIEDGSDWTGGAQKPRSYYQDRAGSVKVSPSPNAHQYLPPHPDRFGQGPLLKRSQSIADQIGREPTHSRLRSSGLDDPPSPTESDTHRRLMRSFSLDKLSTAPRDPMTNHPPPMYQYHSTGSSENPRYIYSSGYHSDTTLSSGGHDDHSGGPSRSGVNPNLSSFTVPGPPPHYQTGPSRVRISAPTYSPLKRTNQPTATVQVRAQPLGGPRDGRGSPESATRTFSTEDLNAEMQHLEGLMKDLNAITASELEESSN